MRKLLGLSIVALLVWGAEAWGDQWGGTAVYQFQDSVDMSLLRQTYADSNFGTRTRVLAGRNTTTDTLVTIIRPAKDPRQGGAYTDDSMYIYIAWSTANDPNATDESCYFAIYPIKRDWGEGNSGPNDVGQTAEAGECSWNAAQEGTQDWTIPGASSSGNDRFSTAVDTVILHAISGDSIRWRTTSGLPTGQTWDTIGDGQFFCMKIPDTWVDTVFAYGVGLFLAGQWGSDASPAVELFSDDYTINSTFRPYFVGWETAPSTASLPIGAVKIGACKIGPPSE